MQQLGPLDAIFLSIETAETPTHIGGLALLDPSTGNDFGFDRFRAFVGERLRLCPRFGWKLQEVPFGMDLPYWVEDGELELERHVHKAAVPQPGGTQEVADLVGYLFARPLHRDRPLWEMFYIEGLQGGRVAMLWKVSHALMDGVSGAGLVDLLFDIEPEPAAQPLVPTDADARAGRKARLGEMLRQSTRNSFKRPGALGRHVRKAVKSAIDERRSGESSVPVETPRVSFNGNVGPRRAVAWTTISLEEVKAAKNALGASVNDVVLGVTGGALRRYLEHNDELPETPLTAMVPISTRDEGDKSLGNQIIDMPVTWATDVADPVARLRVIQRATKKLKERKKNPGGEMIPMLAEGFTPALANLFIRAACASQESTPLVGSAVVSNVPCSPVPLFIAGARIAGMVPMSVLAPTQGLNITVLSYCGDLHFGITVDPELVPEPWLITDGIPKALLELQESISRRG